LRNGKFRALRKDPGKQGLRSSDDARIAAAGIMPEPEALEKLAIATGLSDGSLVKKARVAEHSVSWALR
jgi:hypothetical protein